MAFSNAYDRRRFLQSLAGLGIGAAAAGCGATGIRHKPYVSGTGKRRTIGGASRVVLVNSHDRREAAYQALAPLRSEVAEAIGSRRVVVKINCGVPTEGTRKCSTYPDQLRGILDFLREIHDSEILISENVGAMCVSAFTGYELYGLLPLEKEYPGMKFIDANDQPYSTLYIRNWRNRPNPIDVVDLYRDPAVFLVSAARMKTHNAVVATLSLKNVVMGAPICHYRNTSIPEFQRNEKAKMHGDRGSWDDVGGELSYNLTRLALEGVQPDLSVIDGVTAIEGDGPWGGDIVEHGVAVASTDFVAADRVCVELMGINPNYMKYLEWCGDLGLGNWNMDNIRIEGARIADLARTYRLHKDIATQIKWMDGLYEL